MHTRYETDNDLQDLHETRGQDREISLGTTTILGIFFALALLCAVFFGFGYGMGRRSTQPVASAVEPAAAVSESAGSKPSSGSPLPTRPSAGVSPSSVAADDSSSDTVVEEREPVPVVPAMPASRSDVHAAPSVARPVALTTVAPGAAGIAGSSVVQVAAVSHQEDANVLVSALKQRGYSVAIRQEPQDKLLHVQIGPFTTKKDADAMRQRLQADGYNAIVK